MVVAPLLYLIGCGLQVICDRHFGGINYPVGGVGAIAQQLADGFEEHGGEIMYRANVKSIVLEDGKAVSLDSSCHLTFTCLQLF